MKKIIFALLFAFCFCGVSEKAVAAPKAEVKKQHDIGDYEEAIKYFELWIENVSKKDYYKDTSLVHKETKKETKFTDLTKLEKHVIYLWQAEKLTNLLIDMEKKWKHELFLLKIQEAAKQKTEEEIARRHRRPEPEPEPEPESDESKVATTENVEKYLKKLKDLRKKHAVRFEALAEKIFTDFKDKFPKKDSDNFLRRLRKWHDDQKLIDRKKSE